MDNVLGDGGLAHMDDVLHGRFALFCYFDAVALIAPRQWILMMRLSAVSDILRSSSA